MHTVMWTFKVPGGTSKQDLANTINATAHTYQGIARLIRKYYGIAEDLLKSAEQRLVKAACGRCRRGAR